MNSCLWPAAGPQGGFGDEHNKRVVIYLIALT